MNNPDDNSKKTKEEDWLRLISSQYNNSYNASRITCYPHPDLNDFYLLVIEAEWGKHQGAPAVESDPLTFRLPAGLLYQVLQSIKEQLQLDVPNQVLDQLKTIEKKIDQLL